MGEVIDITEFVAQYSDCESIHFIVFLYPDGSMKGIECAECGGWAPAVELGVEVEDG